MAKLFVYTFIKCLSFAAALITQSYSKLLCLEHFVHQTLKWIIEFYSYWFLYIYIYTNALFYSLCVFVSYIRRRHNSKQIIFQKVPRQTAGFWLAEIPLFLFTVFHWARVHIARSGECIPISLLAQRSLKSRVSIVVVFEGRTTEIDHREWWASIFIIQTSSRGTRMETRLLIGSVGTKRNRCIPNESSDRKLVSAWFLRTAWSMITWT